jgi:hypothetical protein
MDLGENKVEELMRQTTISRQRKVELFLFELGVRVNKLQILHKDDSVEIKPKIWLDKKNWIENLTKGLRKSRMICSNRL